MNTLTMWTRATITCGMGLLLGALLPPTVHAQISKPSLDGRGGFSIPTGRISQLTNIGPSAGLQVDFPMGSRVAVMVEGQFDNLVGKTLSTVQAPDLRLWTYGVGVEANLLPTSGRPMSSRASHTPMRDRFALRGDVAVGATTYDSQSFQAPGSTGTESFNQTYFQSNAGLMAEYLASSRVRIFVGAQGTLTFADKNDTAQLTQIDPTGTVQPFGTSLTVPIMAGLTIRM